MSYLHGMVALRVNYFVFDPRLLCWRLYPTLLFEAKVHIFNTFTIQK